MGKSVINKVPSSMHRSPNIVYQVGWGGGGGGESRERRGSKGEEGVDNWGGKIYTEAFILSRAEVILSRCMLQC